MGRAPLQLRPSLLLQAGPSSLSHPGPDKGVESREGGRACASRVVRGQAILYPGFHKAKLGCSSRA